jgi:hypothetical protein
MIAFVQTMTPAHFASWLKHQQFLINFANNQVGRLLKVLQASGNVGG